MLDASVLLGWALPDERSAQADAAVAEAARAGAAAPALLWAEFRNSLLAAERRGRLDAAAVGVILGGAAALPLAHDAAPREAEILRLARTHRLTVYNALYLELAARLSLPLATLDAALAGAAAAEGVALHGAC